MATRDTIVIGTSMGGIEALKNLAAQFQADLPATVLAVVHMSPNSPTVLDRILGQACPLDVSFASDLGRIESGSFLLAPPDRHLLVMDGKCRLSMGPKENMTRPAIAPLFRSAAVTRASRVIGVVLTGLLDDGTAGLSAIKRCGGLSVVQDPADAMYPDMPRNALESGVEIDHCLPLSGIGALLQRLCREEAPANPPIPQDLMLEVDISMDGFGSSDKVERLGRASSYVCPECGGPLYEMTDDKVMRYRCLIGHAYTGESLLSEQGETVERALGTAMRVLEERAKLLDRLANDQRRQGRRSTTDLEARSTDLKEQAQLIRKALLSKRV